MAQLSQVNPNNRTRYVLERERSLPPEQQTVWVWRPLTNADHFEVMTLCAGRPDRALAFENLRRALVDVEKLGGTEDLKEFPRDADGGASRELLGRVRLDDLVELARARGESERVTTEQVGKS